MTMLSTFSRLINHLTTRILLLFCTILPIKSYAQDFQSSVSQMSLAESLYFLQKTKEPENICPILRHIAKNCDHSCTPYILDFLHNKDPEVFSAACQAATHYANPRFAPVLKNVLQTSANEQIRTDALRALLTIGRPDDYFDLVQSMQNLSDGNKRQIIRGLPEKFCSQYVKIFAPYAKNHDFVTSVVHAFRSKPEILFTEILSILQITTLKSERQQLLRTLDMLADQIREIRLSPAQLSALEYRDESEIDILARIHAALSTPQNVSWILAHIEDLSTQTQISILDRLNSETARAYTDAFLISSPSAPFPNLIQKDSKLPIGETRPSFVRENNESYDVVRLMATLYQRESRQWLISSLGSPNYAIAHSAMNWSAGNSDNLSQIIQILSENPDDDNIGKRWFARWTLVWMTAQFGTKILDKIPPSVLSDIQRIAQTPHLLHAEPSLWFLHIANIPIQPPTPQLFSQMRPDIQMIWIKMLKPDNPQTLDILSAALFHSNLIIQSEVLNYLFDHPSIIKIIPNIQDTILTLMDSEIPAIQINALAIAGLIQEMQFIKPLNQKLNTPDSSILYNTIWALQKNNALPPKEKLRSLYYQITESDIKNYLGFLSDLDYEEPSDTINELSSHTRLQPGQIFQITSQRIPQTYSPTTLLYPDNPRLVRYTNQMGWIQP